MDTKPFRAPPRPAIAEVLWIHQPILPCRDFPAGQAGMVFIESTTQRGQLGTNYLVVPHVGDAGQVVGWRFIRGNAEGPDTAHDIDTSSGYGPSCDCPDSLFRFRRPGGCKHMAALRSMKPIQLPTHRSAAEAAEHIVFYPVLDRIGEVEPPDRAA